MSLHTIKTNSTLNECQSNGIENQQLQVNQSQDCEKEIIISNNKNIKSKEQKMINDKSDSKDKTDSNDTTVIKSANNSQERKISGD